MLLVNDSVYVQLVLRRLLEADLQIEVVGQVSNGQEALRLAEQLEPDVIMLDVEMPKLDGLEVLEKLLPQHPIPVIILSSLAEFGAEATVKALELGAVDFVGKPGSAAVPDLGALQEQLHSKIRVAASARVMTPVAQEGPRFRRAAPLTTEKTPTVLIASSTGGPGTLAFLLSALPSDLPAAIAITQHMPPTFTKALAHHLNKKTPLQVKEVQDGDALQAGTALVARGGYHMILEPTRTVHLSRQRAVGGMGPAADPMMESAAHNLHTPLVGVVLTGMGQDGARGIVAVKEAGGTVMAQDEESCVIYGMPKAAAATGCCDWIVSLADMPQKLIDTVSKLAAGHDTHRQTAVV